MTGRERGIYIGTMQIAGKRRLCGQAEEEGHERARERGKYKIRRRWSSGLTRVSVARARWIIDERDSLFLPRDHHFAPASLSLSHSLGI